MKTNRMTMLIMSAVIGTAAMAQPQSFTTNEVTTPPPAKCQEAPPAGSFGCSGEFKVPDGTCGPHFGKKMRGQKPTAEEIARRHTERMTKTLSLTPVQQEQIGKMNLKNAKRHEKMHAKMMKKHAKQAAKGKKRMAKQDAQLKRILSADQYQKMQQLREEKAKKRGCPDKGKMGNRTPRGKGIGHHHPHHRGHKKHGLRPDVATGATRPVSPTPDVTIQPVVPQKYEK